MPAGPYARPAIGGMGGNNPAYANRRSGATTGACPGFQTFLRREAIGHRLKRGGLGPFTILRYMHEQSLTIMQ